MSALFTTGGVHKSIEEFLKVAKYQIKYIHTVSIVTTDMWSLYS